MKLAIILLMPTEMYTGELHLTAEKEVNSFRGIVWNREYRLLRSDEVIF